MGGGAFPGHVRRMKCCKSCSRARGRKVRQVLERCLGAFWLDEGPEGKLAKLHHTLSRYRFPQADTVPLLAALLSLPHPAGYPPITVSPQRQKEKTQAALVAWLIEEAERQPIYIT